MVQMDVCVEFYIDGCKYMWMDRGMGGKTIMECKQNYVEDRQMKIEEDWRIYMDGCKIIWMDRAMGLLHSQDVKLTWMDGCKCIQMVVKLSGRQMNWKIVSRCM